MIIQCEKCRTKFRLDDSRVSDKGVKVRCSKCKSVFRVQKDTAEAESFAPEGAVTDQIQQETVVAPANDIHFGVVPVINAPFESLVDADSTLLYNSADLGESATSLFDQSGASFEPEESLKEVGEKKETGLESAAMPDGEVDFSDFDFGESESEIDSFNVPNVSAAAAFSTDRSEPVPQAEPRKEVMQGLDFSDDMFGEVVQTAPEAASEPITFDFEGDSFAESMDMGSRQPNSKSGTLFSLETPGDVPFNLGEIDFGDELTSVAVQQVNPDDLKPSQKTLFAPLADAQDSPAHAEVAAQSLAGPLFAGDQQELPPLSIASRRKQSPLFSGLIAVVALLVIAVLGYFGYSSLSAPKENVSQENGKISIRSVKAVYLDNTSAGELLVISGEAFNEYSKPRAALQVKVTVSDSTGRSITTKSAYGGNPLTEDQLKNLPLDKIEAAMANQFGDSLANMEVAPGKAVPFVVVLANLPKGAKDFEVQSAGSTVATGKQQ